MKIKNKLYSYLPDGVSFASSEAFSLRQVYAPLCGPQSNNLKSSITPFLSGDIKLDKHHYLTKPASREDLRYGVRDFFVYIDEKNIVSLAQAENLSKAKVEVGQLWQRVVRIFPKAGLQMEALNFIPASGENVELMRVTVKNISKKIIKITPTAVIPIFGRALANKHDHEHVTALLHRVSQNSFGVLVEPTMSFNEEGHKENKNIYFVYGSDEKGKNPRGIFPTVDSFCGDGGNWASPDAVVQNKAPVKLSQDALQGKEAVGALRFSNENLKPGQTKQYFIAIGIESDATRAEKIFKQFNSVQKFDQALEQTRKYWAQKINSIQITTGNLEFNAWMKWVTIQPVLRRIFGCSFLPDHDYGKGGKGWRDIWQDLLSLILIEPGHVREQLINNFGGIRIDGTNATIIGSKAGEFLADRNAITRVWMDHGVWPFLTVLLYVHQTGDFNILLEQNTYFKDPQQSRTFEKDWKWSPAYGNCLKDKKGNVYCGSILEHVLVQHLVQFFNVGEHNMIRLENADWNDGLDMAFARGESVAFMSLYGGNLLAIADLLEEISKRKNIQKIRLAKEISILLDSSSSEPVDYENVGVKKNQLFNKYFKSVQPELSGEQTDVTIKYIVSDLRKKGNWIFDQIRRQEKITIKDGGKSYTWFNGYYDNNGKRVEGNRDGKVRMTLTGQVFPIMSGLASAEETKEVVKSVSQFLKDKKLGGFRLNTDFGVRHYLDLGRAFGFAYGTKENGAFFSHMNVMYAYSLYKQGFVKEGYEVLNSIFQMGVDTDRSKIYPGIPEYFDSEGRGMYHYLTGSASWLVLTQLLQVFGVRGEYGDLVLAPKLVKEEFDSKGEARVFCQFAGKTLSVSYLNKNRLDSGEYQIKSVLGNGQPLLFEKISFCEIRISRSFLEKFKKMDILVVLGK